jgi:hypothetical protein
MTWGGIGFCFMVKDNRRKQNQKKKVKMLRMCETEKGKRGKKDNKDLNGKQEVYARPSQ